MMAGSCGVEDDVSSIFSLAQSSGSPKQKRKKRRSLASSKAAEACKPPCTNDVLVQGLSQLGKTADGLRPAYLRLDVAGTDMLSVAALTEFPDLQSVHLPDNDLVDLSHCSHLHHLINLEVPQNKLTRLLEFQAPSLRSANFSQNLISAVADLSRFKRLTVLNVSHNQLTSLSGLGSLPMLSKLHLQHNQLINLNGLEQLSGLRELWVDSNSLRSLAALKGITTLEILQAAQNQLKSLSDLTALASLRKLDVSSNQLPSLVELAACRGSSLLDELQVADNPLCLSMSCRLHLVHLLPQVSLLDGEPVSSKEKVLSGNMHGADAPALRGIRRQFFPSGELDDGGGALPPASAGLVASAAEEEITDTTAVCTAFMRVDAWARSTPAPHAPPAGTPIPFRQHSFSPQHLPRRVVDSRHSVRTSTLVEDRPVPLVHDGSTLPTLAARLSSVCAGQQLLTLRVCYQWVAAHVCAPEQGADGCNSVSWPLLDLSQGGPEGETELLGEMCGTWAERVAWLFVHLVRACELEAVLIPGYWKGVTSLAPGDTLSTHNHSWAGVKVNGRWRLLDPAAAALHGGGVETLTAPFFTPPEGWASVFYPLESQWQLLPEPISLDAWWSQSSCAVGLHSRGMCIVEPRDLTAVVTLPTPKEGTTLPAWELVVAAPVTPDERLRHVLRRVGSSRILAAWPEETPVPAGDAHLAYQQVEYGPGATQIVQFGSKSFVSQNHRLITSFPGPGEFIVEVQHLSDVPGGMPIHLTGLAQPLLLRLVDSEVVLAVKVIVPELDLHDPDDGVLHDPAVAVRALPVTHPLFVQLRAQLVSPIADQLPLEADRSYLIHLIAPSGMRLAMQSVDDSLLLLDEETLEGRPGTSSSAHDPPPSVEKEQETQRPTSSGSSKPRPGSGCTTQTSGKSHYRLSVQVPRQRSIQVLAHTTMPDLGVCGWSPLVTFQVNVQSQHLVDMGHRFEDIPVVGMEDPAAVRAAELFEAMDANKDSKVTRKEVIAAIRQNRQVADFLRLPPTIRHADGSLDKLIEGFLKVDTSGLGKFDFSELCLHMGIKPSDVLSSGSEFETDSEDDEDEQQGEAWTADENSN